MGKIRAARQKKLNLILAFLRHIFPLTDRELAGWREKLRLCPDGELAAQGLASIRDKRFHVLGGSFFALYCPDKAEELVEFITALQTISDYLDNLCDRGGVEDEKAFRQLHGSMLAAVDPDRPAEDYYACYPFKKDGGYLQSLVDCCRAKLKRFPAYAAVRERVLRLTSLYCDLQVFKHLNPALREGRLIEWYLHNCRDTSFFWWEFAAACGSTLGIFALTASAAEGLNGEESKKIEAAYFPYICCIHILLDYYIDQEEDRREGDLNFVSYYHLYGLNCAERMRSLYLKAYNGINRLNYVPFHQVLVRGLPALYLSDRKIERQGLRPEAASLLREAGIEGRIYFSLFRLLRLRGVI